MILQYFKQWNTTMDFRKWSALIIFFIFFISNAIFLSRIPGLLGDEGDEGHNVQELLTGTKPPIQGERSYIGVWIDYLRMPFELVFGRNAFALRAIMLIFSCVFFWITYSVLRKYFGETTSLFGLIAVVFSPIYWSEMRIGWAITLLPFFAILTIYLIRQNKRWSFLFVGISAGLGLSTHILFLPILTAIIVISLICWLNNLIRHFSTDAIKTTFDKIILFSIGFWSMFCIQFVNLLINNRDQGNIGKTARFFTTHLADFFSIAPRFISGSLFFAQYTAKTFKDNTSLIITIILLLLIIVGFILSRQKIIVILLLIGFIVSFLLLNYMIEYYAIRYFTVTTLEIWLLAGIGLGTIIDILTKNRAAYYCALALSILLASGNLVLIVFPYLATGGSNDTFPIIGQNRFEYASARVDIAPLLVCISSLDQVFSNNVHIRNRLYYLSDGNPAIKVAKRKQDVRWLIDYRMPNDKITPDEKCPYLKNFHVNPVTDRREVDWPDNE